MENPATPPLAPDAVAAHEFLSELRTRISTQPLPYQYGTASRALESLWEVFTHARSAMKAHPGCTRFAAEVTRMLNVDLRPVTAKWHRAFEEGRLDARDGADEFRADLAMVQARLRDFAASMQMMAYGSSSPDQLSPPVMTADRLDELFADVPHGIDRLEPVPAATAFAVNADEREAVAARRAAHRIATPADLNAVGLGLSGGGIRSATFSLGVIQVLADKGLLKHVDFLSTVSGGGYTGCFLTRRLGAGVGHESVAAPHGPDPPAIRYLRQHAKYLTPLDLKQAWGMVTATLAGMLLNWTAPLLIITLAAMLARFAVDRLPPVWPEAMAASGVATLLVMVAYAWLIRQSRQAASAGGWALGSITGITVLVGAGWLLSALYRWGVAMPGGWSRHWGWAGGAAGLAAAAPVILKFLPIVRSPALNRWVARILLLLAGLVIPLLAVAVFLAALHLSAWDPDGAAFGWTAAPPHTGMLILAGLATALGVIALLLLNVNLTAPHRLYRDRLAATFVQGSVEDDPVVPLTGINPLHTAPYQLINAALNLPSSRSAALRDRRADFFVFSRRWCGSPLAGYRRTEEWRMNGAEPDLATAMAISGAAASSHMGLSSRPSLVALLTFINLRLGFWIRRPGRRGWPSVPGFACLIREMFGIGMSETDEWLNLSDGGHIENMAVYELLRRRCKYVVCVDGEADPDFEFSGLMTLVRHAQLDFGVRIEAQLQNLRPTGAARCSGAHAILGRVHYPPAADGRPAATGLLLYLKLSVTGNEPELIERYRGKCPDFPHQSTVDQFFTEEQFEAYRELGVHVAEGLFSRVLMNGAAPVADVADWFRRLAGNLLEP